MSRPTFPLPPNATIGIVGGGQLGRMTALAAARLGYRCHILTPDENSPAAQVAAAATLGEYEDPAALADLASRSDVVTFEFENVSAAGLDLLSALKPVRPAPSVLRISQDRSLEKSFLNGAGVPTAPWRKVTTGAELTAAAHALGLPAVLKTTRLGYDGKGQALVRRPADLAPAFAALAPKPLVFEGFVDFACEISVIAARGADGSAVAFDAVENHHHEQILDLTLAPARISPEIAAEARRIALRVATALDLVGLIAVEMFVDRDRRVLANEIAPRPHNSGHWTIDACPASQFELFVRAVVGLPLPPAARHSDAVMKNLVGPEEAALWDQIVATPGLIPHLYGKAEARPGRKMGHVTRLFPFGSLPGAFGIRAALAPLKPRAERIGPSDAPGDAPCTDAPCTEPRSAARTERVLDAT
ncbi:MAG: 5-(carboxyamino)imidazole ribonucleotide synthase [Acetobacteraceae bacterium]